MEEALDPSSDRLLDDDDTRFMLTMLAYVTVLLQCASSCNLNFKFPMDVRHEI